MLIESISTVRGVYNNNKERVTVYKTHVDKETNKTVVEAVQFLYTRSVTAESPLKGTNVDVKA